MARIDTILLVDDSQVTRMFVERILRLHCRRLLMASDAEEALRVTASTPDIALVISEFALAARGEFRLLSELKRLENPPGVLLIAGRGVSEADRARSRELGSIGFLTKPIRAREMLDAWEQHAPGLCKRGSARRRLRLETVIRLSRDVDEAFAAGSSHDISPDGMFVQTEGPIPVGTEVTVEMSLDGDELDIHGSVIRVQEPGWMHPGGVAIHFDPEDVEAREKLARHLGSPETAG